MPTDLIQRINPDLLYLDFTMRLLNLLAAARAEGHDFFVISGFRSWKEQTALWAKGRTQPGTKVTNAMGGESSHNFGLAADLCKDQDKMRIGLQPDWNAKSYEPLRELCPKHGLVWGGTYKNFDGPHVNYPGYNTSTELAPLRKLWKACPERTPDAQRLLAVHQYLDALRGQ